MTVSSHTITTAPGHVVAPALVGSVTETGAGHSSASTTDRTRRTLTDCQRQTLDALKRNGNSATTARLLGLGDKVLSNRIHEMRAKGIIGPHEYERVRVSPIVLKVEASRAARTHVLEAIHFARKGHVISSFRCCCGARGRTIDLDRTRGHAELYSRFEDHKRPDTRGTGPRGEHGRLVAEAPMPE
jgi:hypothetical protein